MNYYKFGAVFMTAQITIVFVGLLVVLLMRPMEMSGSVEKLLLIITGAVGQSWGTAVVYWLGSSAGSAAKSEQLADLAAGKGPTL